MLIYHAWMDSVMPPLLVNSEQVKLKVNADLTATNFSDMVQNLRGTFNVKDESDFTIPLITIKPAVGLQRVAHLPAESI